MGKQEKYVAKGVTSEISATSRCAVRIKDNYYTIEATEKRSIPDEAGVDMNEEWKLLFDAVNDIVDTQCQDIINTFTKK